MKNQVVFESIFAIIITRSYSVFISYIFLPRWVALHIVCVSAIRADALQEIIFDASNLAIFVVDEIEHHHDAFNFVMRICRKDIRDILIGAIVLLQLLLE